MSENREYVVVVEKIINDGKHGPYAVARCDDLGAVTFSLGKDVWDEERNPERGIFVVVSDVIKKRAGWRAMSARFVRPTDQQLATN